MIYLCGDEPLPAAVAAGLPAQPLPAVAAHDAATWSTDDAAANDATADDVAAWSAYDATADDAATDDAAAHDAAAYDAAARPAHDGAAAADDARAARNGHAAAAHDDAACDAWPARGLRSAARGLCAAADDAAIWAWQGTQGAPYRGYCHHEWTSRSSRTLSWTQTPQASQEMEEKEVEEVQAKEALLRHKTQNRRIKHGHSLSHWTGIQGQSALHKVSRYCSLFSYSLLRKVDR